MRSTTIKAALALYTSISALSPTDAKMFSLSEIFGGKKHANTYSLKEKRSLESYYTAVYGADILQHKYGDGGAGNRNSNSNGNNDNSNKKECNSGCNFCSQDGGTYTCNCNSDSSYQYECSCETNGMPYPGDDEETYWYVKYVYASSDCSDDSLLGVKNEYTSDNSTCLTYGQKSDGMGSMNNNNNNQQESAESAATCTLREEKNGMKVYEKRFCNAEIVRTPPGVKAVRVEGYWKECCDQNLRVVIYDVQGCNSIYGNTRLMCVSGDGRRRLAGDDMNNNGNGDMNNNGNNGDMGNDDMGDMDDGDMEDMGDMNDDMGGQEGSNSDFYISFCDEDDTTCSNCSESYKYQPSKCYYEGDLGGYRHKYYSCWDDSDNAWVEEYEAYLAGTLYDEATSTDTSATKDYSEKDYGQDASYYKNNLKASSTKGERTNLAEQYKRKQDELRASNRQRVIKL